VGSLVGKNGLNLLVNNAAIMINGTVLTSRVEDMNNSFNTNVIGPLLIIRVRYCKRIIQSSETSISPTEVMKWVGAMACWLQL